MFTVLECVAMQHDHAVVLLAAVICLLGMFAFFHLLLRAEESPAGRKPYWVLVAAFAACANAFSLMSSAYANPVFSPLITLKPKPCSME